MSFPEIGLAPTPNLNKTENVTINFGWMRIPQIGLAHAREFATKGYSVVSVFLVIHKL